MTIEFKSPLTHASDFLTQSAVKENEQTPADIRVDEGRREVLKGAVGATVLAMAASAGLTPRSAQAASCPPAPPPTKPWNFLVIMMDDAPLDAYTIIREHKGQWLKYVNSSANDPLCAPGRAATLSGQVGQKHEVKDNNLGYKFDFRHTWIRALSLQKNYHCAGFGKLMNAYGQPLNDREIKHGQKFFPKTPETGATYVPPGFNVFHMMYGNSGYYDYKLTNNGSPTLLEYGSEACDYSTDVARQQILDYIDVRAQHDRPWAIYWAPNAPHKDAGPNPGPEAPRHADWTVCREDSPTFNAPTDDQPEWLKCFRPFCMTPCEIEATRAEHTGALKALYAVDEAIEAITNKLESIPVGDKSMLDHTIIMVLTDHAHMYGAFGLQDKGTSFEDALNLLLRVRYPTTGSPIVYGERPHAVSNIDIGPTICDLAGIDIADLVGIPNGWQMNGQSFACTFSGVDAPFRNAALYAHYKDSDETPAFEGLRFKNRKITRGRDGGAAQGQTWRYNLNIDPYELKALSVSAEDLAMLDARLIEVDDTPSSGLPPNEPCPRRMPPPCDQGGPICNAEGPTPEPCQPRPAVPGTCTTS